MTASCEIENQHGYHPATKTTAVAHTVVRDACIDLAHIIDAEVPDGPEKDEAQKALHLVRMWSNMGIAVHGSPLATSEQKTTPQPVIAIQVQEGVDERLRKYGRAGTQFTCPNCQMVVTANATGHINPHWVDKGYDKTGYSCTTLPEMAG